jgi:hypothetical protein
LRGDSEAYRGYQFPISGAGKTDGLKEREINQTRILFDNFTKFVGRKREAIFNQDFLI